MMLARFMLSPTRVIAPPAFGVVTLPRKSNANAVGPVATPVIVMLPPPEVTLPARD